MLCEEKLNAVDKLEEKLQKAHDKVAGTAAAEKEEERLDDRAKRMRMNKSECQKARERPENWRVSERYGEARYVSPELWNTVVCFLPLDLYNNGYWTDDDFNKHFFYTTPAAWI
jgi:hypothetical protein